MTITFAYLKNACSLSDENIIKKLKKYNKTFFESWIIYNKTINKEKIIDDYIIDLPVTMIDEIIILLNK
ncbi:hypothetical protein M0Q97_06540 [Candidatus Dojkabacteria bacterium]|jgi:hypothetical protein|nr:hypothetical protein [Candidatus Dojkabacteria bacterium]